MSAPKVEIYTTAFCGFCNRAKAVFTKKGVPVTEIDVSTDAEKRHDMMTRAAGRMTVPQVFIGGKHVGGYEDVEQLERDGKLDALLKAE
jgi:glutaredoxin 3